MVSFLDLPKPLRETIYRYCHLVRPCPIDLGRERERARLLKEERVIADRRTRRGCSYLRRQWGKDGDDQRFSPDCLHPLLPLQLFTVCRQIHTEVFDLFYEENHFTIRLQDSAGLAPLVNLTARGVCTMRSLHVNLNGFKKHPRSGDTRDWREVCRMLDDLLLPGELRFSLVWHVANERAARPILDKMHALPSFADCAISLHRTPDAALAGVAEEMALWAMGLVWWGDKPATVSPTPFPFKKLPLELQRQVLLSTDLVARWDPTQFSTDGILVSDGRLWIQRSCCMRCTDAGEDCCCPPRRAAFSRRCVCFQNPTPLFRVNRAIAREARHIFYSSNRFTFDGDLNATLAWFQQLPEDALKALRLVDFALASRQIVREWEDQWDKPWRALIDFIRDHLDLSKLWLSIDGSQDADEGWDEDYNLPPYYEHVIDPLKSLTGLAKFHVFLPYTESDYEPIAEKAVMGPDYDSAADGKVSFKVRNDLLPHQPPGPSSYIGYYE